MSVEDDTIALRQYLPYQDWFIFIILLLTQSFVLIVLKFQVDFSGTLTLLMQLIVALSRVIQNYM